MLLRTAIGGLAVALSWFLWFPSGAQPMEPLRAESDAVESGAKPCDDRTNQTAKPTLEFQATEGSVTNEDGPLVQTLAVILGDPGDSDESRTGQTYRVRWRAVGAERWRYAEVVQQPWAPDQQDDWRTTEVEPGVTYEVAVAVVCSGADATAAGQLYWSRAKLATMFALSGSASRPTRRMTPFGSIGPRTRTPMGGPSFFMGRSCSSTREQDGVCPPRHPDRLLALRAN